MSSLPVLRVDGGAEGFLIQVVYYNISMLSELRVRDNEWEGDSEGMGGKGGR